MKDKLSFHGMEIPQKAIAGFCQRWKVLEFSFFGSILREDFHPESDIDVLVSFSPDADRTFEDHMAMKEELESILGHKVDLVEKRLVEKSQNYIRRKHILSHAEPVYVA